MINIIVTLIICLTAVVSIFRITNTGISIHLYTKREETPLKIEELKQQDDTEPSTNNLDGIIQAVHDVFDVFDENKGGSIND